MRFAVNLAFLFTELPFRQRFAAAAEAGFTAVEFPWPDEPAGSVVADAAAAGVEVVLVNAHAGDLAAGDRGYPNDPGRIDEFRAAMDRALELAAALGGAAVNVLAGNAVPGIDLARQWGVLVENLHWSLERARGSGVRLTVEVLNGRDTPAYLLTRLADGSALVRRLADQGVRLQFDSYHIALVEPDLLAAWDVAADHVGHVQIADAPGRGEPGTGDAPLGALLERIAGSGYAGAVALEYVPSRDTTASLGWLPRRLRGRELPSDWSGLLEP